MHPYIGWQFERSLYGIRAIEAHEKNVGYVYKSNQ